MKHTYHVLTALSRYENLAKLIRMLNPLCVQWHVVTDADVPFRVKFDQLWIKHYIFDNSAVEFWARCNTALNWLLDHHPLNPEDRYCFLNDDDAYERDFFNKVDAHDGELVIASMERGHQTPSGVDPIRAHGCSKLVAAPENMRPGFVGVEQVIVSGRILSACRLPIATDGDGQMIEHMVKTYPAEYAPEASVLFNRYEPGRWNK